jgi:uncharacterized protein (DUF427 family)
MANPAPGYAKYPNHSLVTRREHARVVAKYQGEIIADSTAAVALEETMEGSVLAPSVYYFPRDDVRMDRLVRTSHSTYCPFKGHASYYSIPGGPENVAWSYEAPYDELLPIKALVAFYPDKVEVTAAS